MTTASARNGGYHHTSLLSVRVDGGRTYRFSRPFTVGRAGECDVQVDDHHVSRTHLRIAMVGGRWTFTDLQSSNGVFVNGSRVSSGQLTDGLTIYLGGEDGPALVARLEQPSAFTASHASRDASPTHERGETRMIEERYFGTQPDDEPAGPRTIMIRKAYQQLQKRQKRRYWTMLGVLGLALITLSGYAVHLYRTREMLRRQGAEFFYAIQAAEVAFAKEREALAASGQSLDTPSFRRSIEKRRTDREQYERFLDRYYSYGRPLSEEDKVIMKVTRVFGESELLVPSEYLREVKGYIQGWKSTRRFATGIQRAKDRGYLRHIVNVLVEHQLPPEFLYLAMQESDFNAFAVGPPTRYGHAKGMWQFIWETGETYGLRIGPLKNSSTYDAQDERFNWTKATTAAARYIQRIYATDAQASGLLVMASYNWGEGRVIKLIRSLPENPRDRNWWRLLRDHKDKVPQETYRYVFSIVSAAAIGENPRLFGFDFDNPIEEVLGSTRDATVVTRQDVPQIVVNASR